MLYRRTLKSGFTAVAAGLVVITYAVGVNDSAAMAGDKPGGAGEGEIIVFVQPGVSEVARSFEREHLPAIRRLARSAGLSVTVVDAGRGVPAPVTTTPSLIYQDHRGRSSYQGRYTTLDRMETFLRTAQLASQEREPLRRENVPVWTRGRAQVAAPIKVAPVTGQVPEHHDPAGFASSAREAVLAGLRHFHLQDVVDLQRSDRSYYMDFNPWLSPDGTLHLSVELYSQFHCKKPVFTHGGKPFVGPWVRREALFAEAARALEDAIIRHMAAAGSGDAFDPVASRIPVVSFEALGLALPPAPPGPPAPEAGVPRTRHWITDARKSGARATLVFHFPSPLSGYSGEVRRVRGKLDLASPRSLKGASASFEVDVTSVTMGEPDLDDALQGGTFLGSQQFPQSTFITKSITADRQRLQHGQSSMATMDGIFTLKSVSIPLTVRASFEPAVSEDGAPRLNMKGTFRIPIGAFAIEGPDGPEPARSTLVFQFQFMLEPVSEPQHLPE